MAEKGRGLTRALAIAGAVLVWLPLAAMVLTGLIHSLSVGRLRVDYLMPAELFPLELVGGGLLVWAALRARVRLGAQARLPVIAAALGGAVAALVGSQALAVVTGLASGRTPPQGPWFGLVMAVYALFLLAVVVLAWTGVRLVLALRQL